MELCWNQILKLEAHRANFVKLSCWAKTMFGNKSGSFHNIEKVKEMHIRIWIPPPLCVSLWP